MTLKTRRILLAFCIILFLILSPIIILYTFGFRYDFKEKRIIQTGIIYITPVPESGVRILVNGVEEKKNLSVKGLLKKDYVIYNLLPQTYKIQVQKDGYVSWEKNLVTLPGVITYAHPLLLPNNPSVNAIFSDNGIASWSFSPDHKKIAYLKGKGAETTIAVYDTGSKKTKTIKMSNALSGANAFPGAPQTTSSTFNFTDKDAKFFWSPDSERFTLVLGEDTSRIVILDAKEAIYLAGAYSPIGITFAQWNGAGESFAYVTPDQKLYSLNVKSVSRTAFLVADNISGFTLKNNDVYYLDDKGSFIYRFPLNSPAVKEQVSFEPLYSEPVTASDNRQTANRFIMSPRNDIVLITASKDLFLIKQGGLPERIGSNIESAEFSSNGNSILYNSPFEIFTFSLDNDSENLVTRVGQKISNVEWYKDYDHVWFYTNNMLKNIELDSRPIPNIVNFLTFTAPVNNIIYDNNSGDIYYGQIEGGKLTVYQVNP